MIAKNFIRYPEALAQQLCLAFTRVKWATARPGSRILRAIRTARGKTADATTTAPAWMPPLVIVPATPVPAWLRAQRKAAKALAQRVRALLSGLTFAA